MRTASEGSEPMIPYDLCKVDFTLDQSEDPRFPHWPCPACGHGVLQLAGRSIRFALSAGMSFAIDIDPLANFEANGAFCATMVCVNEACRQGVVVIGDYSTHTPEGMYSTTGRGGYEFPVERKYVINAIHPAFRLINIPQQLPQPILAPLEESFALYWGHPQACAASIRTAIEGITDHLRQPRKVNGNFVSLAQRLKNLTPQYPDLAKVATAIKNFGNIGARGNTIEREKLLAAYELVEIELRLLFEDTDSRRDILIGKLQT
jgi:uncharacterized protein DUF4145